MAKTSIIHRNLKRQKLSEKHSERRAALKTIIYNRELPMEERFGAQIALDALSRDGSKVRYRNRCKLSGRGRGVESRFELSRICIRELANEGLIPGLKKSSW